METRVQSSLERIQGFSSVRVLVIGDLMLDTYLHCQALGVADEAPVPLLEICEQSNALGGAANVARNLAQLGAGIGLVGLVGNDAHGDVVRTLLQESSVDGHLLQTQRPTVLKTRVLAGDHYYLRLDEEQPSPLTDSENASLATRIEAQMSQADLVVVSDYDKGMLSSAVVERIEQLARQHHLKILADLKPRNVMQWRRLDLITPNLAEALSLCSLLHPGTEPIHDGAEIAESLRSVLHCDVVLKMGSQGMLIAPSSGSMSRLEALCHSPRDTSGAGDTVLATLAAAMARGADLEEAAWLANLAASVSVSRPGTHAVSAAELSEAVTQTPGPSCTSKESPPNDENRAELAALEKPLRRPAGAASSLSRDQSGTQAPASDS